MCSFLSIWIYYNTISSGYPSPHQGPGSYSTAPYPVPHGGYGDPNHAPPLIGFHMGYNHKQPHPGQPVMYQPVPMPEYGVPQMGPSPGYGGPMPGPEYGAPNSGPPAAISPAPAAVVPVGVPPGLEYLTQVGLLGKSITTGCQIHFQTSSVITV